MLERNAAGIQFSVCGSASNLSCAECDPEAAAWQEQSGDGPLCVILAEFLS